MAIPNLKDIQSIIVFNGGSFGDFLKGACHIAYDHTMTMDFVLKENSAIEINSTDRVYQDLCFKMSVKHSNEDLLGTLNSRLQYFEPIENSHYYQEEFHQFCNHIMFIDYKLEHNDIIASAYINKKLLDPQYPYLLKQTREDISRHFNLPIDKITNQVLQKYIAATWRKQLLYLRSLHLDQINLYDLLSYSTLAKLVERITRKPVQNEMALYEFWINWAAANEALFGELI